MDSPSQPLERFSRRRLFGSGFGRALDSRLSRLERSRSARRAPDRTRAETTWGEADSTGLGTRLEPARQALLEAVGAETGVRLLDASAGDGLLAVDAARRGAWVTAREEDAALATRGARRCADAGLHVRWISHLPHGEDEDAFDAVVSCFSAGHGADQRRLARELTRSAAHGGALALTAWQGLMAAVMQISAPDRHGRSQHWSRHELVRAHFERFPGFSVRHHFMSWQFADEHAALAELAAPVRSAAGRRRLRDAMPDLVELYGRRGRSGLTLRADYALVFARRP